MEREFKTPKELLDFVLTECGEMKYGYSGSLTIKNYTVGNYILLASQLLERYFNRTFNELSIINIYLTEIED